MKKRPRGTGRVHLSCGSPSPGTSFRILPLRVLVLCDFGGSRKPKPRRWTNVDKYNLPEVFRSLGVNLHLDVANRLSEQPPKQTVRLPLTEMRDFTPERIVQNIPELAAVHRLLGGIEALAERKIDLPELEQRVSSYNAMKAIREPLRLCKVALAGPPAGGRPARAQGATPTDRRDTRTEQNALHRILDMVDIPGTAPQPPRQILWELAGPSGGPAPPELVAAAELAGRSLAAQLDTVLHDTRFQRIEAAWRGVQFLVDRTDFRQNISLEMMDVDRDELADTFHRHVFLPEYESSPDIPLSLVVLGFELDKTAVDLTALQTLAEDAEALQVPILFSVGTRFLGLTSPWKAASLPYVGTMLDRPEFAGWNALRNKECSRWLAAAFNPFLLRDPYTHGGRKLGFEESLRDDEDHLWGSPAWAVASLVTASFARRGWPTEISGPEEGCIPRLPVRPEPSGEPQAAQIPLGALLPMQVTHDLTEAGIIPLSCTRNRDAAYVRSAPVLHRPARYADERMTRDAQRMATLPYQLLVTRLVGVLRAHGNQWAGETSAQKARQNVTSLLRGLVEGTGAGAGVEVEVERKSDAAGASLSICVRMGRDISNGAEVRFELPCSGG